MPIPTGRPVYLNLVRIKLPVAGIMSIVHRVTGVVMVLVMPPVVYLLDLSLRDSGGFQLARDLVNSLVGTAVLFLMLWALVHHLLAGIRYLLIDVDVGVEKPHYGYSALAVLAASPLVAALLLGALL
ncbi:MAG: succinate dehydrogenase, cytochrome b556 subunit [Pseudomonadota bacterium]